MDELKYDHSTATISDFSVEIVITDLIWTKW